MLPTRYSRETVAVALLCTLLANRASLGAAEPAEYLNQGWTEDERHDFYYLSQGSQLVPYHWFLWLELPGSGELFRSDRHMASLGYIAQPPEPRRNPHGLPIGLVLDDNPGTVEMRYALKKAFLGPDYRMEHYPPDNAWLGLTCAACHTADLRHRGKTIRIDGGPAMIDHERLLGELAAALRATHGDDEKFTRFAKHVLDTGYNTDEAEELRKRVDAYTRVLERLVERNKGDHPYGFARLDAFGAILNQICETALEIPENHAKADAPVSFPFLWDAPHLDWVQWNAAVAIPIERNVGEVLGVYAHAKLTGTPAEGQFTSTARVDYLFRLEQSLAKLKAPTWPADAFGAIDCRKAEAGEKLFAANCAACHGVRDENGRFPMTAPNAAGKQFIRTTVLHADDIGTDPQMARNFSGRTARPGALAPHLPEALRDKPVVPAALLLKVAARGVTQNRLAAESSRPLDAEQLAALNGHRDPGVLPPKGGAGYKARPLNGIWATAPYLHNGSVPNLDELLKPAQRRVKSFRLGSREFDPVKVGFRDDGGFEFDTTLTGNSNGGHSGPGHTQAKQADGTYRDFTDDERRALVEYLKTLK